MYSIQIADVLVVLIGAVDHDDVGVADAGQMACLREWRRSRRALDARSLIATSRSTWGSQPR